jgi:hypothetical protein
VGIATSMSGEPVRDTGSCIAEFNVVDVLSLCAIEHSTLQTASVAVLVAG